VSLIARRRAAARRLDHGIDATIAILCAMRVTLLHLEKIFGSAVIDR